MIEVAVTRGLLKIHIDGLLHLCVMHDELAVHSWIIKGGDYFIQYTQKNGTVVTTDYDDRSKFEAILKQLDKIL